MPEKKQPQGDAQRKKSSCHAGRRDFQNGTRRHNGCAKPFAKKGKKSRKRLPRLQMVEKNTLIPPILEGKGSWGVGGALPAFKERN